MRERKPKRLVVCCLVSCRFLCWPAIACRSVSSEGHGVAVLRRRSGWHSKPAAGPDQRRNFSIWKSPGRIKTDNFGDGRSTSSKVLRSW